MSNAAFIAGRRAHARGTPLEHVPYYANGNEWESWRDGWLHSARVGPAMDDVILGLSSHMRSTLSRKPESAEPRFGNIPRQTMKALEARKLIELRHFSLTALGERTRARLLGRSI